MKSDVFKVDSGADHEKLLAEVERVGTFTGLTEAEALRLRLLAEEMLGLIGHMLSRLDCDFWVENKDKDFELHLKAHAPVTIEQRDELVALSSKKENEATKGVLGKISGIFQSFIMGENEMPYAGVYAADSIAMGGMGAAHYTQMWSMAAYQDTLSEESKKEDWDGLEKSIVASMADDVIIGVTSNLVEMVVKVRFA